MKKLILYALLALSFATLAQNTIKQPDGNYQQVQKKASDYKPEGAIYTDKDGVKYPVYRTSNNKLFILRKSKKSGKEYRYYLKF